ncbi:MAG TPA: RusA family crossover junction endodeoxyribonuclease [Pseudonocardiaceae bacterium]
MTLPLDPTPPEIRLDMLDFPTAWEIQRRGVTHTDPRCSAVRTDGAMLCDCGAVTAEWNRLVALAYDLDIFVTGKPAPQGSKRARPIYRGRGENRVFTGKVAQVESSKQGVDQWRADVRAEAQTAWAGRPPLDGAILAHFDFVRPRPLSTPKRRTPHATTRPDVSKLARSTEDALTSAGVYRDDSLIVDLRVTKRIAELDERTGCRIRIKAIP